MGDLDRLGPSSLIRFVRNPTVQTIGEYRMRFEMSTGDHEPAGQHFVVLDNRGRLMDLSEVNGTLHDPTMTKVTWGLVTHGADTREGGTIFRINGPPQQFFDRAVLKPYLDAFKAAEAADATI